ncbi:LpxI family protein [Enterovirga sp. CN4-39]|uniref:LpxI family protein n=1 Tax=Enterovirga sp. CN4-39 TaxID=3400910 RepID=UPI003C01385B
MAGEGSAGPVAILAGSGELPLLLANSLSASGREARILAFRGFASRAVRARADLVGGLLDAAATLSWLERLRPACVTLAGGLRRPDARILLDAYSAFRSRGELRDILGRGDDNLLRAAIGLIEEKGFPVLGLRELAPELLAGAGQYGAHAPDETGQQSIATAIELLRSLSSFDMGQAAVVAGRRVIAVEGPEGTDGMLARVRGLRRAAPWRRPERGGVLVKAPKQGQDLRVDLPAIGPRTVRNAARAGLRGIAVAARHTVVLDAQTTRSEADRLGLFLLGIEYPG